MTNRELYNEIMHYGTFNRMPSVHWKAWTETYQRWPGEGYPTAPEYNQWDSPKEHEFFGTQPHWDTIWYEAGPFHHPRHAAGQLSILPGAHARFAATLKDTYDCKLQPPRRYGRRHQA